jgi:hypothetical protein
MEILRCGKREKSFSGQRVKKMSSLIKTKSEKLHVQRELPKNFSSNSMKLMTTFMKQNRTLETTLNLYARQKAFWLLTLGFFPPFPHTQETNGDKLLNFSVAQEILLNMRNKLKSGRCEKAFRVFDWRCQLLSYLNDRVEGFLWSSVFNPLNVKCCLEL